MIAIAFALRGTLTSAEQFEHNALIELLRERCRALDQPFRLDEAHALADELFPPGSDRFVPPAQLAQAVIRHLDDVVAEPVVVARFRQIAGRNAARHVKPLPATTQTLERVASLGIPTAVLCNGWSRIAQREAECANFAGPVLVSEDIGAETPSGSAFDALVAALGVPADRVWYVGNDPRRDVDGAARAGLHAIWLNRTGTTYPRELTPPALTIRELAYVLPPLCEEYTRSLLSLRHLMRTALEWRDGHFLPPTERW